MKTKTVGDLQVWWIPQLGMSETFEVDVKSVEEGVKIMDVLANYDLFQFDNNVKGDYSNVGGLSRYCEYNGIGGWEDWYDEETGEDNPKIYLKDKES